MGGVEYQPLGAVFVVVIGKKLAVQVTQCR